MKKILLSLLLLCCVLVSAHAQRRSSSSSSRDWAVGLRLGDPFGINGRKYFGSGNALDVTIGSTGSFYGGEARNYRYKGYDGYRQSGVALMVNYIWQKPISSVQGLEWYWGLGGQLSSRRFYYVDRAYYNKHNGYVYGGYYETTAALGVDGLIGLEWMIPNTPISLFSDLGLYLEIVPAPFWMNLPFGIGGRFNF